MGGSLSALTYDAALSGSRDEPGAIKRIVAGFATLVVLGSGPFLARSAANDAASDDERAVLRAMARVPQELCVSIAANTLECVRLVDGTMRELQSLLALPRCRVIDLGGRTIHMPDPQPALLLDRDGVTLANGTIVFQSGFKYRLRSPSGVGARDGPAGAAVDDAGVEEMVASRRVPVAACLVVVARNVSFCNVGFVEGGWRGTAGSAMEGRAPSQRAGAALIVDGGSATLQGCWVHGCAGYAVQAVGGAQVSMQACDMVGVRGASNVCCVQGSAVSMEGCTVRDALGMGCVAAERGCSLRLERCRVSAKHFGVYVFGGAHASITDCEFVGIPMQSVRAKGAGSFVELSGSSMFRNCDPSSLCAVYGARIIVRGMVGVERLGEERVSLPSAGTQWTDSIAHSSRGGEVEFQL